MAKSHMDIYLNCDKVDYHKGYITTPARYTNGQKICGFCHMLQIHPNDSFAAYNIKRLGVDFLEKYWDYNKKPLSGKKCADTQVHNCCRVHSSCGETDVFLCLKDQQGFYQVLWNNFYFA